VSASLTELLQGAGLPPQQISSEVLRDLGQALRVVVQGVMDVLHARTDIKTQFRLPITRVQSSLNNPLKLSPNVEAALYTLLVEKNSAYLPTSKSFEDAFRDIRHHQMALLGGVREAFDHMLATFDPERLETELDSGARRGLLRMGGKSRFKEQYAVRFAALMSDRDGSFRRLFGDCFGEAYEKQLEQLKAAGRQRDDE
jgi:type VI secretion system FHA domain protein